MTESRRPRKAIEQGPTAATVAANIRRIRNARGMSTYELSRRLAKIECPLAPSALAKVERGERQVGVDELMTLAVTLGVSPSALLLPPTDDPGTKVSVTGAGAVPADEAWDWVDGRRSLDQPCSDLGTAALEFALYSRPPIRRNREIGRGHE
ncbi:helix-turn-helix domain-containing protein [Streptomyces sp. NPDC006640]|uniref:helix-turn-helix domain-containing protein n=1 Tax=Streptomyces sp. NPDC006640 TaxID=3364754 RepID=UPI00367DE67B